VSSLQGGRRRRPEYVGVVQAVILLAIVGAATIVTVAVLALRDLLG
jgi:hypothetical protein